MGLEIVTDLHENQAIVWECPSRYRVIAAGRRWGKTTLAIFEMMVMALNTPNGLIWYVAPTYKQAKSIAWIKLKQMIPSKAVAKINESELCITIYNGCRIELKGCDKEDSLRGVGVDFLVFDEIGVVDNAKSVWEEVLRPMLVDKKAPALFIGTPKGQNYFYDIFELGQKDGSEYKSFRFKTEDNPYIERSEVAAARRESHPTYFAQEYEASFVTDEENTLITSLDLSNLYKVYPAFMETRECVVCDPSQGGDECVIYAIRNFDIIDEEILHERDTMKIAGHISVMAGKHNIKDIGGDCIGIGAGIFDRLSETKLYDMHRIHSAEQAMNPKRFANVRAEMWWETMELIRDRKVPDLHCSKIRRQLTAVRYRVCDSNGKIQLEPKAKTKVRLSESPDRGDTYVMGCYMIKNYCEPVIKDPYRQYEEEEEFNPMTL